MDVLSLWQGSASEEEEDPTWPQRWEEAGRPRSMLPDGSEAPAPYERCLSAIEIFNIVEAYKEAQEREGHGGATGSID